MTRTLGATFLAACLTAATASAADADDSREDSEPAASRIIQPTQEELEAFQLPRPQAHSDFGPDSLVFQASGWGMIAASAADVATTEWGLSRGLAEGNPMASNRTARVLHHIVGPAAVWYTTEKLQESGKKKLALSLRIALMAAYSYAALHNTRQIGSATP